MICKKGKARGGRGREEGNIRKMTIAKKIEDGKLSVTLTGRLDTNTAPQLEAELSFDGVKEAEFDFSGLEYISSAGLRILMTAHKAVAAYGGSISVLHPNAMVKGVFAMTGLSDVFKIVE